ncbi:hypothetical protein [Streptomyces acidicola]|uniref:hypothetical protein n=1 Tax=Streptomyces acidicola TaxID=2596892 RepID=UPI0038169DBF
MVFAGDDTEAAERALVPFLRVGPVLGRRAALVPYAAVVTRTGMQHMGHQGAHLHNGFAVHLDGALGDRLEALVATGSGAMLQIRSVGGAINDVDAGTTAFAHRHQNFSVTAVAGSPSVDFDTAWEAVRPSLDGLCPSFETAFSPQRLSEACAPATLSRRREIKRDVDPDNVFDQNFPVA